MKILALILAVMLACAVVSGQVKDPGTGLPVLDPAPLVGSKTVIGDQATKPQIPNKVETEVPLSSNAEKGTTNLYSRADSASEPVEKAPDLPKSSLSGAPDDTGLLQVDNKFNWKPAIVQSFLFLAIQHSFRMTQPKTTRELGGKFFADWGASVKNLKGWSDGNKGFTNYVAHPMQGSLTGRIFINNSGRAKRQEFGTSKEYWTSRLKAMAWTAVWSTQFEIGPVSEATIGNVGQWLYPNGKSKMSYVDFVITPTVGTGFAIAEDAIDKYVLKNWIERGKNSKLKIKFLRSVLTPTMSFANLLRGKMPWYRDFRLD